LLNFTLKLPSLPAPVSGAIALLYRLIEAALSLRMSMSVPVLAEETVLNAEIPKAHTVTVESEGGNPIPGVTVEIGDKTDVTDEDSRFEIENMPSEIHSIVITDKDGSSQTGAFLT